MGRAKEKGGKLYTRQPGETTVEYALRIARAKANTRDKAEPLVSDEARQHGRYRDRTVMHIETATRAVTAVNIALPRIIEQWHAEGRPGFEQPAMDAMRRCIALWEARPLIGSLVANYAPTIPDGSTDYDRHIIRAMDDTDAIERYAKMFHPAHWRVFEAVVRYDKPVGVAGGEIEDNGPQSTASARAIVGTVANFIAMHMRA